MAVPLTEDITPPRPALRLVRRSGEPWPGRRRRLRRSLVGLLLGLSWVVGVAGSAARHLHGPAADAPPVSVVVEEGDTLWAIARRHGDPGADPRAVVEAIRLRNGVDARTLAPGRRLEIPAGQR